MPVPACNGNDVTKDATIIVFYLYRSNAICVTAISQLTIEVISPCPDRSVGFQGNGMPVSACNGNGITDATYLYWGITIIVGAISQLTIGIIAPCPDSFSYFQRYGMQPSSGNLMCY